MGRMESPEHFLEYVLRKQCAKGHGDLCFVSRKMTEQIFEEHINAPHIFRPMESGSMWKMCSPTAHTQPLFLFWLTDSGPLCLCVCVVHGR
jgi:hypothetical protein